ncbi:MAG TPA: [FeFe] hydrogenase H-cluster maturation GTPase HydF [Candidatus Deferrimicrobium sp.]|nr:[FeFe] hydrogenase H-cluster maturation GTPase HydF [Candidatus Deferrimicrobium sp.]
MQATPIANRLHIGLFGKRNAGKSSLLNLLTNQAAAVVAPHPGTTTDPVFKPMELLPLGPVVFVDTAGMDDYGELGELRVAKTLSVFRKTDIAVLVVDSTQGMSEDDLHILKLLMERESPFVIACNKSDLPYAVPVNIEGARVVKLSAKTGEGLAELKLALVELGQALSQDKSLVGGLVSPGDFVILVTPIDTSAPKGRLILPQQQTIRDLLEHDAIPVVTKEQELRATLEGLTRKPSLVITDSQAFLKVAADTPKDIPLTSFSILFARQKGDLVYLSEGAKAVEALKQGDKVLIVEGCTHHRQADDLGKVKIPRWLRNAAGGDLEFTWVSGVDFPIEPKGYQLIVHCGGCMLNRKEMLWRINSAKTAGIPMINYGVLIAYIQGILGRSLAPFGLN